MGTDKGFTGADPDALSQSAAALWKVVTRLESTEKPLALGATKCADSSEVPDLAAALRRFGAAVSAMTHQVSQQSRAANTLAFDVAQDIRAADGH